MMELSEMTLRRVCEDGWVKPTWPESDWLDSGARWGCTHVVHWLINVHSLNQPSPHTLKYLRQGNMEHQLVSLPINFYIKPVCSHHHAVVLVCRSSGHWGGQWVWHAHCYRHDPYSCLISYHGNILQLTNTLAQYYRDSEIVRNSCLWKCVQYAILQTTTSTFGLSIYLSR